MNKIKIRNGVVALIKGACQRLRLSPREFMMLHELVRGRPYPSQAFATACATLEDDSDSSALRTYLSNPNFDVFPIDSLRQLFDSSYSLLYEIVYSLYVLDTESFFDRNVRDTAVLEFLKPTAPTPKCTVCRLPMFSSPGGWVCNSGHGGAEDPLDPAGWDLLPPETNQTPAPLVGVSDAVKEEDYRRQDEAFGSEAPKSQYDPVARPDIPWNDGQNKAFKEVFKWYSNKGGKPIFRMFGYAGSGKTSMAKEIAWVIENGENVPRGMVMFAAYTGKAASVLRSKGCTNSSTIHSLIYKPRIDRDTGKVTGFSRNEESPLRDCTLLIVDEVSQVNEEMAMDLMEFGVRILVLGDPKQLKPIKGEGYFTQSRADVMLTTVERTAKDDPITYLATLIREGGALKPGRYGESRVYAPGNRPSDKAIMTADQILVGMRNTRDAMNRRYRMINGKFDIDSEFPVKGDRLMCLKNNKQNGLMNGTIWQCTQPVIQNIMRLSDHRNPKSRLEDTNLQGLHFKVRSYDLFDADGKPLIINTVCSAHHFDTNIPEPNWRDVAGTDQWGFGYASTLHKAQGSQWDNVVLIDQSDVFPDQVQEHLYTGITRAVKKIRIYL